MNQRLRAERLGRLEEIHIARLSDRLGQIRPEVPVTEMRERIASEMFRIFEIAHAFNLMIRINATALQHRHGRDSLED